MALTLRENCERRLTGLKAIRQPYEQEWREIAQHAQPSRSRFLVSESNRNFRRTNRAIYNSHGILSFRTLAGGMTSGLSSPSRPWFRLKASEELSEDHDVAAWLAAVEKLIYDFLNGTNFYAAVKTGYSELGMFGTSACVMVKHDVVGAVCHQLTAGEYWIATGDAAVPDTLYRRVPMTVHQAVQQFGYDNVSQRVRNCYDTSRYEDVVEVVHAIEPNDKRGNTMLSKDKPWRSVWWDCQDGDKTTNLRESGYDVQPFWAPRWETCGGDAYGTSPGMDALPDLRELQLQTKRKTEATAFMVKPEKIAPASVRLTGIPGNVVAASSADADGVKIPYQMPYQAIDAIMQDMQRCADSVDRLTFAETFMAITNLEGSADRTVPEINARIEEKMTQLGSVIERVNSEQNEVVIDRVFDILRDTGRLPPAPEAMQGQALGVDFVSVLAQAQRSAGLGQIERILGFAGNAAGADPEILDNIDFDGTLRMYSDRAGAPPEMMRGADQVKALRENRAQQKQAEQMASMMPAVKDGASAAELLTRAAQNSQQPAP